MDNLTDEINTNLSMAAATYAQDLRAIKLTVYLLILLFSVTGNTLVILAVVFFQRLKTVPNIFIANLAACDLVTTLSSIPFDLPSEELGYWPYGDVMCKILWPLATFSTTSAVLTLVAISLDRYGALLHPLNFRYKITKRKCIFVMCFVYGFAALAVLPYLLFLKFFPPNGPNGMPQCGEDWPELKLRKSYTVFLFAIQYGFPLLIMSYIYTRLGCLLQENTRKARDMSSEKKPLQSPHRKVSQFSTTSGSSLSQRQSSLQRRKEQNDKTVKMFFVIVIIFVVFMLPNQILWLLYDFGNSQELNDHLDLVAFICRSFTYTNSVLNATVYGACNSNFRLAFKAIIRCKCGRAHQREAIRTQTMRRGRGMSEINFSRVSRSPQKRGYHNEYKKPDSFDTVDGSSSELSPSSPVKCYKADFDQGKTNLTRKITYADEMPSSLPEKTTCLHHDENKVTSNGAIKDKNVNINNNIKVFTFETPSKETKL